MLSRLHAFRRYSSTSVRFWTLAMAGLSLGICLAVSYLHYSQNATLQHSRRILRSFREARIDLSKGFLHLTLAGDPRSPFRREVGIALLDQAIAALGEVESQLASEPARAGAGSGFGNDFSDRIIAFRKQLLAYGQAAPAARNELMLPLNLAFHELERLAQHLDSASQHDLNELAAKLRARFQVTLVLSALLLAVMCVGIDLVGRRQRQAEAKLRSSEMQLRALGDNIPGGALYRLLMPPDGRTRFTYVSAGFERIFGMPTTQVMADSRAFYDLIVEEDRPRCLAEETRCARTLAVFDLEFRQRTVRGDVKWIHARSTPSRLADGSILWDGVVADVTERTKAAAVIHERLELQDQLEKIVATVPGAIFSFQLEPDGRMKVPYCTPRIEELWGIRSEDLRQDFSPAFARIRADDAARVREGIGESARTLQPWHDSFRVRHPRHGELWLEGHSVPRRGPDGSTLWHGFVQDITDRKKAEEALRRSEERLNFALRASRTGAWSLNLEDRTATRTLIQAQIFGYSTAEENWSFEQFMGHVLPEERERIRRCVQDGIASNSGWSFECPIRRVDGQLRWVFVAGGPEERGQEGVAKRVHGIVQDITERKQTALDLQSSEERFRALVETTYDWVWEVDLDGRYTYVSPRVGDLLGYTPAEVLGRTPFDFMCPDEAQRVGDRFREIVTRRQPFSGLENTNRHKSGRLVVLETNGVPVFDPTGRLAGYRGMDRDITERRRAEQALRNEAERLTTILDAQREIAGADLDYPELIRLILERMARMTNAEGACLEVAEGEDLVYEAGTGIASPFVGFRLKIATSLSGTCLRSGELLGVDDSETDPRADREACRRIGSRSMLLLPLRYDENSLGVLKLMSPRVAAFSNNVEPTLRLMGEFLSATVARKKVEMSLRRQRNELRIRNRQLERFNRATVGRELRMVELKQEINQLCRTAGLPERYGTRTPPVTEPSPTSAVLATTDSDYES